MPPIPVRYLESIMYIVTKSVGACGDIGNSSDIAECEDFDAAVEAAVEAGARGRPQKSGHNEWLFSGGPEHIGYWITEQ